MAGLAGRRMYQSGFFEILGLLGQLLVALPNLDLFAGSPAFWLRIGGLVLATLYVCILLVRLVLPDQVLESMAAAEGPLTGLPIRLRAGRRAVVVPVTLVAVVVAGISLFGARLLGLDGDATAPGAPANLRSTGVTAQQVDLAWDAAFDDGSGVNEYRVVRADNGLARTSTTTSFHDTMGVGGGMTYRYTVVAVDEAGNVSDPSELSVTTPVSDPAACAVDTTAPSQPVNVRTQLLTSTSVTLEWDRSTDIGSCGLAGYRLFRDGLDTGILAAGVTATEEGLESDHSYVYTVAALDNADNESEPAAAVTVKTLARPVQTQSPCELVAPPDLRSAGHTPTSVSLVWSPPSQSCEIVEYRVYRGPTLVGQTSGLLFTVGGLAPSTGYVFTVRSRAADGAMSPSSTLLPVTTSPPPQAPPDTTPPTTPTNLRLVQRTATTLGLAWNPSTDAGSGVATYQVFVDGNSRSPASVSTVTLTGLVPLTDYEIGVRAVDNAGNVSALAAGEFTTAAAPAPPPGPGAGGIDMAFSPDSPMVRGTSFTVTAFNFTGTWTVEFYIDEILVDSVSSATDSATSSISVDQDGSGPAGIVLGEGLHDVRVRLAGCGCTGDNHIHVLEITPIP